MNCEFWIVLDESYHSHNIVAAFQTEEEAKKFIENKPHWYTVDKLIIKNNLVF